jgi:hypothetical protein
MRGTTILRRLIAWDLQDWTMPPLVSAFLTQRESRDLSRRDKAP